MAQRNEFKTVPGCPLKKPKYAKQNLNRAIKQIPKAHHHNRGSAVMKAMRLAVLADSFRAIQELHPILMDLHDKYLIWEESFTYIRYVEPEASIRVREFIDYRYYRPYSDRPCPLKDIDDYLPTSLIGLAVLYHRYEVARFLIENGYYINDYLIFLFLRNLPELAKTDFTPSLDFLTLLIRNTRDARVFCVDPPHLDWYPSKEIFDYFARKAKQLPAPMARDITQVFLTHVRCDLPYGTRFANSMSNAGYGPVNGLFLALLRHDASRELLEICIIRGANLTATYRWNYSKDEYTPLDFVLSKFSGVSQGAECIVEAAKKKGIMKKIIGTLNSFLSSADPKKIHFGLTHSADVNYVFALRKRPFNDWDTTLKTPLNLVAEDEELPNREKVILTRRLLSNGANVEQALSCTDTTSAQYSRIEFETKYWDVKNSERLLAIAKEQNRQKLIALVQLAQSQNAFFYFKRTAEKLWHEKANQKAGHLTEPTPRKFCCLRLFKPECHLGKLGSPQFFKLIYQYLKEDKSKEVRPPVGFSNH